ncbi:MAG TPA: SMI1/KNR4 family protein [Roseomonas sp.]|jgi:hypothetical protein
MWLFGECPAQRAARSFHSWMNQVVDIHHPADFNPPVPPLERDRMPLPQDHPPESWCLTGPLSDLWDGRSLARHFIVSAALRAALDLSPEVAQFRPITLFAHDPAAAAKGYCLMRLLVSAPAMDAALSRTESFSFPDADGGQTTVTSVSRFVLARDVAAPADLFWAEEKPDVVIATEALAARVQAAGLSGLCFGDPWELDDFGEPQRQRSPGGDMAPIGPVRLGVRPVRDPVLRPPFTPTPGLEPELLAIEAAIGHRLPGYYTAFLRNPPPALREIAARSADFEVMELAIDPASVLALNQQVRAEPEATWLGGEAGWPADWLAVGEDGCGNYTVIDLGCAISPVLHYDHEFGGAEIAGMNLGLYAEDVVREWYAADADEEVRAARRAEAAEAEDD